MAFNFNQLSTRHRFATRARRKRSHQMAMRAEFRKSNSRKSV
jgi:hypothetical protein